MKGDERRDLIKREARSRELCGAYMADGRKIEL